MAKYAPLGEIENNKKYEVLLLTCHRQEQCSDDDCFFPHFLCSSEKRLVCLLDDEMAYALSTSTLPLNATHYINSTV